MTVTVTGPDGSSFDFPDGTPQDEMTQAMDTHYGAAPAVPPNPDAAVPVGIAKAFGSGVVKGGAELAGLPGDAKALIDKGLSYVTPSQETVTKLVGGPDKVAKGGLSSLVTGDQTTPPDTGWYHNLVSGLESARSALELPTSADTLGAVQKVVPLHEPQTTPEKYAATVGEFLPGAMAAPGEGTIGKAVQYAAVPGAASQAASQATQALNAPGWVQAAAPIVAAIATPGVARKFITPISSTPEQQAMVAALRNEGIDSVTAGQATGNKGLQYWEGDLNPGRNEQQAGQFTQAALSRIGINEPRATIGPNGNVTQAEQRIGQNFDGLSARNTFVPDQQLASDLRDVHTEYNSVPGLNTLDTTNAINGSIKRVANVLGSSANTMMPGADYQKLRSQLSQASADAQATNRAKARGLRDVVNALDDNMERSIQANNPADAGAWTQARRDYRNLLVIQKARSMAGEGAASGFISPAQLASATKSVYGKRDYLRGNDDFSNLAEPGVSVMSPLPDSGTSQRNRINSLISAGSAGLGSLAGAAAGGGLGGLQGAGEGGVLGLLLGHEAIGPVIEPAARRAINSVLMSRPMQRGYLPNNLLPKTPMSQDLAKQLLMAKMLQQQLPQSQGAGLPTRITVPATPGNFAPAP